jgi:hypothetical protein
MPDTFSKGDVYEVKLLLSPDIRRIYTDETLPDELKYKLGLLLSSKQHMVFGVGHSTVVDNMYTIYISDELYSEMIGEINDEHTREQSQSVGKEVTSGV